MAEEQETVHDLYINIERGEGGSVHGTTGSLNNTHWSSKQKVACAVSSSIMVVSLCAFCYFSWNWLSRNVLPGVLATTRVGIILASQR
jgi:hypothetical protein